MKLLEEVLCGLQSSAGNCISLKNVTQIHKRRHALNHHRRYMASNGSNINLNIFDAFNSESQINRYNYLH